MSHSATRERAEVPKWLTAAEGDMRGALRIAGGDGAAVVKTILAGAPVLAAEFYKHLDTIADFELRQQRCDLPPKYTTAYKGAQSEVQHAKAFCLALIDGVLIGINEPWALKSHVFCKLRDFQQRRRHKLRAVPRGLAKVILEKATQIVTSRKANDYKSLRRELGRSLQAQVSDSSITKVLNQYGGILATAYGPQFAPPKR